MNLVLFQFNNPQTRPLVRRILKKLEAKEVHNFWPLPVFYKCEHEKPASITIHERYGDILDILSGFDTRVNFNNMLPLDEAIIGKMTPFESEAKAIIGRYSSIIPEYTRIKENPLWDRIDELKSKSGSIYSSQVTPPPIVNRIYYRFLRYWYNFFLNNKIDVILSEFVTHGAPDYLGMQIGKILGIPTVSAYGAHVTQYTYFFSDYIETESAVKARFKEIKKSQNASELKLSKAYQSEWDRLTQTKEKQQLPWLGDAVAIKKLDVELKSKEENSLFYVENFKEQIERGSIYNEIYPSSLKDKLSKIMLWSLLRFSGIEASLKKTNLLKDLDVFYESSCSNPDYSEKYIYLPLHFQPEATTIPLGGIFRDQLLIVEMLHYYFPDTFIYIKEHHADSDQNYRSKGFYRELLKMSRVRLISRKVSTFELLEKCMAVATITGTAGWEGLFKGKPCLLFGYHLLQYGPGVFAIRNNSDCEYASQEIKKGLKISLDDLKFFIKAIEDIAIHTSSERYTYIQKEMSEEEWLESLSEGYVKAVQRVLSKSGSKHP